MTKHTEPKNAPVTSQDGEPLIEEGSASIALAGRSVRAAAPERFDVIVIGAGQAGLSVGYHLAQRGLKFLILEGNARIGDSWRKRWDSLRLFTPARYDGLDGMPFPAPPDSFPTKDQMGDYLQAYAERFALPVRCGTRVSRLCRRDERYVIEAGGRELEADQVVVAMANYQQRKLPSFAAELGSGVTQLHSSEYKNPAQLRAGGVLLVGAGNSGSEIALELARKHHVVMSGRDTGHVPFRIAGLLGRLLLVRLVLRVMFHYVMTLSTPIGRTLRPKVLGKGGPLIRVKPKDLAAAGVERAPRTVGVRDGRPLLDDGRVLDVANVIWCTGFHHGFSWIELPVMAADGEPRQERGVATDAPGLYFVGLHFQYAMSSTMIHGVGRDAAYVVEVLASAARQREASMIIASPARLTAQTSVRSSGMPAR